MRISSKIYQNDINRKCSMKSSGKEASGMRADEHICCNLELAKEEEKAVQRVRDETARRVDRKYCASSCVIKHHLEIGCILWNVISSPSGSMHSRTQSSDSLPHSSHAMFASYVFHFSSFFHGLFLVCSHNCAVCMRFGDMHIQHFRLFFLN